MENFEDLSKKWKVEKALSIEQMIVLDDSCVVFNANFTKITLEIVE